MFISYNLINIQINKYLGAPAIAIVAALAHAVELHNGNCSKCP